MFDLAQIAEEVGGKLVSIQLSGKHWRYGIQIGSDTPIPNIPIPYTLQRTPTETVLILEQT